MSQPTFKELEHVSWRSRAILAPITRQAVGPLLNGLHENFAERDLLDCSHFPSTSWKRVIVAGRIAAICSLAGTSCSMVLEGGACV